ncbi:MAG: hypothetical protein LAT65_08575 [Saccharospirillum sp.]|nr:hypothetical protein [Saccharospirillum sp.]
MKPQPDKKVIRRNLKQQVDAFLSEGGEIKEVDQGVSGYETNKPWTMVFQPGPTGEPKQERTPVPEVLAAIDARKHKSPAKPKRRKPQKVWIYDDFGEPVRWVWKEE